VWLLERYQQIEHPLITELFQRSLERLQPGIATLDQNATLATMPRLYVLASDDVTAFSLCDGSIFITSKMFKMTPTIDVFMAILAHEASHLIRKDACWITEDTSTELSKEISADTDGARILYGSYINPRASLLALSLYYRKFKDAGSDNFTASLETRKKSLSHELGKYPQITTKIPEERLFRKVKVLLHQK
jgi:hypothetical protein